MPSFLLSLLLGLLLVPLSAAAQNTLSVNVGTKLNLWTILGNIIGFLGTAAYTLAPVFFLVGVLMYAVSGIFGDMENKGRNAMIGVLIGFAVVIGAYSILRTVYYFLS